MDSILKDITKKDIKLYPFPHLNIPNALSEDIHQRILSELPSTQQLEEVLDVNNCPDNNHYFYKEALKKLKPVPTTIIEFLEVHSSEEFLNSVIKLFEDHINEQLPYFRREAVVPTSSMCVYTNKTRKEGHIIRGPHLDSPHDMFVFLYYLKPNDMHIKGGDLELYKYKTRFKGFDRYSDFRDPRLIPHHHVEKMMSVPFVSNQFVLILDGIRTIHGVSPIQQCDSYRIRLDGGAFYENASGEPNYYYTEHLTPLEVINDKIGLIYQGLRRRLYKHLGFS